ncbi:MAG TPA: hypothetical protein VEA69_11225 [Tepidisphaeraceae bacterium]|nr:hypothetical protein [Tepidisphaeraceae bacterium]
MSSRKWKTLEVERHFVIQAPVDATVLPYQDGVLLTIVVSEDPRTEVLADVFDVSAEDVAIGPAFLKASLTYFVTTSIASAIKRPVDEYDIQERSENGRWSYQALVPLEMNSAEPDESRFWLARTEWIEGQGRFFLIHWNGPMRFLRKPVLRIFESFTPMSISTE